MKASPQSASSAVNLMNALNLAFGEPDIPPAEQLPGTFCEKSSPLSKADPLIRR
jgi:hypothetical protein